MGTIIPPVNQSAEFVNAAIRAANSAGIQFVMALAIADVPWLGFPGIKQLFGFILGWLDGYISKAEQTGATFVIIDLQVGGQETALSKALQELLAAQKTGDPEKIKEAIKKYADAQSALVHYDGGATPR